MPIILHIGTHKTGTTAIQQFATTHRRTLRQRGVWYPLYRDIDWISQSYAHHAMSHALAGDDRTALEKARRFATFANANRRPNELVLLSAEAIYRHLYPASGADYWSARAGYARRLRDLFPSDDVKILLVVRRQDRFAKSLYQEQVLAARETMTFSEFVAGDDAPFRYQKQLDVFEPLFGPAKVMVYEDISQELIDAFFAELQVRTTDLSRADGVNESLPVPLVEYRRLMNQGALEVATLKMVSRALRSSHFQRWHGERHEWVASAQMQEFASRFNDDNILLAQRYFPDRTTPLFPEVQPFADELVFAGLTAADVAAMTAALLLALNLDRRAAAETQLPARFARRLKTLLAK